MSKNRSVDRSEILSEYRMKWTEPESDFDELTQLAASVCDAPVAMINFLDEEYQYSKSVFGLEEGFRKVPRNRSICQFSLNSDDPILEIPDLSRSRSELDISLMNRNSKLNYYIGVQLSTPAGIPIGALCVLDYESRRLSEKTKEQLRIIARQVMTQMELKKQYHEISELNKHHVNLMKMLSHDLRSPLSGIIGISEMVANMVGESNDEVTELLQHLNESAIQLNQLIDDILNYSLIESRGFRLNPTETDVKQIAENLEKLYLPSANFKNIELTFSVDPMERDVWIDQEKFEQIFGNLLSNAIKFSDYGGRVESLISMKEIDDIEYLELKVSDDGIGMSEELKQEITKGSNSHGVKGTRGEKGTGLGLAIVKSFTDLHNGEIEIESAPGEGTSVSILLPLHREQHGQKAGMISLRD